jgi:hypothetical protein
VEEKGKEAAVEMFKRNARVESRDTRVGNCSIINEGINIILGGRFQWPVLPKSD